MSGTDRLSRLRNIGVIAHIDAGKTTVTERMLFHAGLTHRLGNVDDGNTVTDFMPQERERGITIQSAAITCDWKGHQVNIIDTPGHIDFTAEVQRALRVLDGGVVVFDGVAGVEPQSETVWHQADRYHVPRVAFVNKMDRPGASVDATVASIHERLGARAIAVQMPIGQEATLAGVVDLLRMQAIYFDADGKPDPDRVQIPAELLPEAKRRREEMIEAIADVSDEVAMAFLEGDELPRQTLLAALREATLHNQAVPVLCGSAMRNIGVVPLLDAVLDYLPSPLDVEGMTGHLEGEDTPVVCQPDDDEPLAALMFKLTNDPFMGKMAFFRVYSGTIRRGDTVLDTVANSSERIGRLLRMRADRREEVEVVHAGDIGAVLGFKSASTGHTLAAPQRPVVLEQISFPAPVIEVSVTPRQRESQDKLGVALQRLVEEDPTLQVRTNERTGETVLAGMGELHLDVVLDRLKREFRVDVRAGAPQVAYCETITRSIVHEGRLIKQTGGRGQYAVVVVEFEPLEPGSGFVFENAIIGGAVPKEYIPAVERGMRSAMEKGPLAKMPVVDIKARLVDGKFHEVDSSERAFETVGSMVLREAMMLAGPVLLEPVMAVEVVAPQEYTGDIIGDLASRAGTVNGIEPRTTGVQTIDAHVPLAKMFGYATSLRSATQGRGTFTMQFSHYQQVSEETRKEIASSAA